MASTDVSCAIIIIIGHNRIFSSRRRRVAAASGALDTERFRSPLEREGAIGITAAQERGEIPGLDLDHRSKLMTAAAEGHFALEAFQNRRGDHPPSVFRQHSITCFERADRKSVV